MSQEPDDFSWVSDPEQRKMHQDMAAWHRSPEAEQFHAETRNEAAYAEKWFAGTKHLFDENAQEEMARAIQMTKSGRMTHEGLRDRMGDHSRGVYTSAPDLPAFEVPNHLSDQFVSEVDGRFRSDKPDKKPYKKPNKKKKD